MMPRIEVVKLAIGWVAMMIDDHGNPRHVRWSYTADRARMRCLKAT